MTEPALKLMEDVDQGLKQKTKELSFEDYRTENVNHPYPGVLS